jgi:multidrug efflux pump subunit AcrB
MSNEVKNINTVQRFVNYFLKNTRLTILLIPLLIGGGIWAYQSLPREGFPPIEIPTVIVSTPYFVNDANKVDVEITQKLESIVEKIEGVKSYRSTTNANFSNLVVTFEDSYSSLEGANLIKSAFENNSQKLAVEPNVTPLKVASRDNKSDLIFSIAKDNLSTKELQEVAQIVADQLTSFPEISDSYVISQVKTRVNPITREELISRESFGKFAVKNTETNEFEVFDSISIGVVKSGESITTTKLSEIVRSKINDLSKKDGVLEGFNISYNGDFATILNKQIGSLESNALGAILIIVVLMFFLINWRSSLILAVFFPLTLCSVFLAMSAIGLTLNTITLFALILVLGLFVDDGIIIVEAVDAYKKQGYKNFEAVRMAISSIGIADVLGTITTVLVFVPILFVSGPLGEFIRQIPITVILSLTISLLVALSIVSFLSGIFLPNKTSTKTTNFIKNQLIKIENITLYLGKKAGNFVRFYLGSKLKTFLVIFITIILIVGGSFYASQLKFNIFSPSKDSDIITLSLNFQDQDINGAIDISKKVDDILINTIGENLEDFEYVRANDKSANIFINLTPLGDRDITSVQIADKLSTQLAEIENLKVSINTSVAGPPADPKPFKMQIYADEKNNLEFLGQEIESYLYNTQLKNTKVTEVSIGDAQLISKKDGKRFLPIEVGFDEGSTSATITELQEKLESSIIPLIISENSELFESTDISFGFDSGFASANAESFSSIQIAFIVSILIMYILLMVQFNSFSQPILILLAIPFSFILLFPGLYITNNDLSFFVTLGLTALIGLVVNNSIVLVEYTNQARKEGMSIRNSISKAVEQRFRPILSTTLTSVVGLIPLAISEPFWEPLALTIIFGLISSSIFVIFAYPAFFAVIEKIRGIKKIFNFEA